MPDAHTGIERTHLPYKNASGVILFWGDLVCLSKRCLLFNGSKPPFAGYWSPFTGAIEVGESPAEAAIRELHEESGLKITTADVTYINCIKRPTTSLHLYAHELAERYSPVLDSEHTEYGYFQIRDLDIHPSPLCESIRNSILLYQSKRPDSF